MSELKQARSIEEFFGKISRMVTDEGRAYAKTFSPRSNDILISTFAKAGTTWMQQIVHGLRTGGDMNFEEITFAVPWIEMAYDLNLDLSAEQLAQPRAFKTHDNWEQVAKGCRYIYIMRNPLDTAVSMYNFMNGWFIEKDAVSLEEYVTTVVANSPYWQHLLSWWPQRNDPDILFLTYEGMKADHLGTVKRVAKFMDIDKDSEAIAIATEQSTFEFMNTHNNQFDDNIVVNARNEAAGLPAHAKTSKVQTGKTGAHKQALNEELITLLNNIWNDCIETKLGFSNYDKLIDTL